MEKAPWNSAAQTPSYFYIVLTTLTLLPYFSLKIITPQQLHSYLILGGRGASVKIIHLFPSPYREAPLTTIIGMILGHPQLYTLILVTCLIIIPLIPSLKKYRTSTLAAIPLYAYSFMVGDPITPLIYLFADTFDGKRVSTILKAALFINNPEYGLISPIERREKFRYRLLKFLVGVLGTGIILYQSGYTYLYGLIQNPMLLTLYITSISTISILHWRTIKNDKGYFIGAYVTSLLNPQTLYFLPLNNEVEDASRAKKVAISVIIAIILIQFIAAYTLYNSVASIEENPGLEQFISNTIPPNSNVIAVNIDPTIEAILDRRAYHISIKELDYEWNWSNYEEVKANWETLMDVSRVRQIKYIIIEKSMGRPAYWPPTNEYKTSTYYLSPDTGKELVVIENTIVVGGPPLYSIIDVATEREKYNFIPRYIGYWSNITGVNITVSQDGITIEYMGSYVIYLWFENQLYQDNRGIHNLVLGFETLEHRYIRRIRSLEIYASDTDKLGEATITISNLGVQPIYILNTSKYSNKLDRRYIVIKIEAYEPIKISKILGFPTDLSQSIDVTIENDLAKITNKAPDIALTLEKIYPVTRGGEKLVLSPHQSLSQEVSQASIKTITQAIYIITALGLLIPTYLHPSKASPIEKEKLETPITDTEFITVILTAISIPILYYIINNPYILGVGWIGGGAFVYYVLMSIPMIVNYTKIGNLDINSYVLGLARSLPIALATTLLIKQFIVNSFYRHLLYSYWHVQSIHSSVDYLVFGTSYIAAAYLGGKGGRTYLLPNLYLVLYGILGLVDVTRALPPYYLGTILYVNMVMAGGFLSIYGYSVKGVYTPFGLDVEISRNGLRLYNVIIGWPCSGLTGLFLYLAFTLTFYWILSRDRLKIGRRMNVMKAIVVVGAFGAFILNGLRIAAIIYLAVNYSINASEVFHSTGYDIVYWIYVSIVIWILYRIGKIT